MSASESGERTEQASERQMKENRKKGKISRSADLSSWTIISACVIMLPMVANSSQQAATEQLFYITKAANSADSTVALQALVTGVSSLGPTLLPILALAMLAAVATPFFQGPVYFKSFAPKFDHFNPVNAAKKIFGPQAWWNALKALLKASAVGILMWIVIQEVAQNLMGAGILPTIAVVEMGTASAFQLLWFAVVAGIVMAVMDMLVVARRNRKVTKVTKNEAKQEHKQQEGDPLIRSQRKSRQMSMSRNRMISEVSSADAVIVNPIHVAVAIRYKEEDGAPTVVALGKGEIASKIREKAEEADIPLIKNVDLAWVMHDHCKVGRPVPPQLYGAIATVIAFTMRLDEKARRRTRIHTIDQVDLPEEWTQKVKADSE